MADSVQFSVSVTPIEELTTAESGGETTDTMWPGTAKSLGGSGAYDLTGGHEDNIGYGGSGVPAYVTTGGAINADTNELRGLLIRHTGYLYSSATVLGAATTDNFSVTVGAKVIADLGPGQAFFLPNDGGAANDLDCAEFTTTKSGSSEIAVEFLAIKL